MEKTLRLRKYKYQIRFFPKIGTLTIEIKFGLISPL